MMTPALKTLDLVDLKPPPARFRDEVVAGLRRTPKSIPCKFFYDAAGSALFEAICDLPEYYPTRTETGILERHLPAIAARLGRGCLAIEYGSGSGAKTRLLLDHLPAPAGYLPIDISREQLMRSAAELAMAYPGLDVLPVCADYTLPLDLPPWPRPVSRRVVFYPGSTIGNFHPAEAEAFLAGIARVCGRGGGLLIGVDLEKDRPTVERAYNDADGVTAAFNLNLLARVNRELEADFDLDAFDHRAPYNAAAGRIEMHLVSRKAQRARVGAERFQFAAGEAIVTEYSYKYDLVHFAALARRAGFDVKAVWTDPRQWFSVQYLEPRGTRGA
jgi:dimethylhistidine N-methyltransferase